MLVLVSMHLIFEALEKNCLYFQNESYLNTWDIFCLEFAFFFEKPIALSMLPGKVGLY